MSVEPPTGDEKPQKYYGSPYLGEIENLQDRLRNATASGAEVDVSDEHPLTVNAVAPNLDTGAGKTYDESNHNEDERKTAIEEGTFGNQEEKDPEDSEKESDDLGSDQSGPKQVEDPPTIKL